LTVGQRTRSIPNRDLERGDVDLAVQPLGNLDRASRLEEQLQRILQVGASLLDGVALAGALDGSAQHLAVARGPLKFRYAGLRPNCGTSRAQVAA
jgi:hypothetical protein